MLKKKNHIFPIYKTKNRQVGWHLLASPLWVRQASSQRSEDVPPFILINFKKAKIHFHVFLRTEIFFLLIILYKSIRRKPEIKTDIRNIM